MVRRNYLATARIKSRAGTPPTHGRKVEDAIVRAVIQHTDGLKLQVDVVSRLPASAGEKSVATVSLFIGIAIGALGGGDGTFKPTSTCSDRGSGAVILRFSGAVLSVEDTSKSLSSVKSTG